MSNQEFLIRKPEFHHSKTGDHFPQTGIQRKRLQLPNYIVISLQKLQVVTG